jgi:hypothetical protein
MTMFISNHKYCHRDTETQRRKEGSERSESESLDPTSQEFGVEVD